MRCLPSSPRRLPKQYCRYFNSGMSDVFSRSKRSEVMARIRGRGNKSTEETFATILRKARISGWRRHQRIPGRPDFVFYKEKMAVFIDGCFWHGCPRCYQAPLQNGEFWHAKFLKNQSRDKQVNTELRSAGWKVVRIWEHQLGLTLRIQRRIEKALQERRQKFGARAKVHTRSLTTSYRS